MPTYNRITVELKYIHAIHRCIYHSTYNRITVELKLEY